MSIEAVAFCPHPPLLIPAVGAGEPVAVRASALAAVSWLASQPVERLFVLGSAATAACYPPGSAGSFAGFGVDVQVRLPAGPAEIAGGADLPLSLAVGAWLLERSAPTLPAVGLACDESGRLAAVDVTGPACGLLVMGDGSARRSEKAPGWRDSRSATFDASVAAAMASGDPAQLLLDLTLGAQLLAAGVPAWNAAGALLAGTRWQARVSYDDAPYGVGYFVATWSRAADAEPARV